ncbi:MAG: EAL domain-containing protein [Bacillota bacterium]|nr:EAL domain-containing protein [Bacillota bacterium]
MKKSKGYTIDINKLIEDKNLEIDFQPIVSVIKKSIIGLEAICVGSRDENGELIPHDVLIQQAEKQGIAIELDRLYREKAVEEFVNAYSKNKELLLFIDINISIIDKFVGSGMLMDLVNSKNLDPENVVLEIVEEKIESIDAMQQFITTYRSRGFLISLKDLGSGFANFDRISYIEPDIIKINRALTKDIEINYYTQEIFKSLINLSKKIGALVIAEDIENQLEAMMVIELGADMVKGRYFGEPEKIDKFSYKSIEDKINKTASEYKNYMTEAINMKEAIHKEYDGIINTVLDELAKSKEEDMDKIISKVVSNYSVLECVYILDASGTQVTDTATRFRNMVTQKALIFQPAKIGTDHSLKKYYYFLKNMGLNRYVTDPYISLATGSLCVTISANFKNANDKDYILCIDFHPDQMTI